MISIKSWDEDLPRLREMCARGMKPTEIAQALGRPYGSVQNKINREGLGPVQQLRQTATIRPVAEYTPPEGPTLAEVFAPEDSADETDEEFWNRFLTVSRRTVTKALVQKYATIRIATDVPVALCISSDWHIGPGCDMDALHAMAKLVASTPGMYALLVGDLMDMPIKHKGSNVGGVKDEVRAFELTLMMFLNKILGMSSGNHEDFQLPISGIDVLKWLAKKHRIHYAPDELLYTVQIISPHDPDEITAEYLIATRHQWRRHSNLNNTHACKTWLQEQQMNWERIPDVLAIGHNHVAAIGSEQYAGKDVHYLRMGSFQRDSAYARAKGFADFRPTAPTVVLPPTRAQRIACFADPQDAIQHMRGWRDVA